MNKLTLVVVLLATTFANCKKDNNSNTTTNTGTSTQNFDITFNGVEYKDTKVTFGSPQPRPTPTYRNVLVCSLWWTPAFYVQIDNLPASGKANFCSAGCDPQKGDIILSFLGDGIMETEFSGTVEYVSERKIKIDAVSKTGKTLTGTIER